MVIGIGINVLEPPNSKSKTNYSFMSHYNNKINVLDVFHKLIEEFNNIITKWDYGNNFIPLRDNWIEYAYQLGEEIIINSNGTMVNGLFSNIDEAGNLILRQNNDILKFNRRDYVSIQIN